MYENIRVPPPPPPAPPGDECDGEKDIFFIKAKAYPDNFFDIKIKVAPFCSRMPIALLLAGTG